ncbi:putative F420-dependent oxidoreductase, MSMEG_4141 family [Mycolicibacterium phlei]|jgi:probable F420-dependent oxidoreductase|uniref:F420-dependent oxidoreductase n=1 Tax=Mycolicibacterium phlei DSM 43239 = CCUG 21000 TaxID=1226750 RepID=A0A5N5VA74_MYCPH|nr:LLM class F420-dependent oxidoreductase [Mycolicibacterium phlei]VEG10392.1 putative F420-dependent oxidoreductase, MSMEG_4141 family [Mycobacteroides chelonae]AMO62290.1 methylenetetrahydromethanopterin reductase [Mycolicibacterium phlei]EID10258.1 putative F420-dependent oxidoreductase, MSMEG_4141 family protein [Mycolicibacterium phlei RIVM601174]KAB7757379.1 F420-dependent oxidoreductase [Mycolicibacterium phlei DSM 43239 = CCUG 21000]KXW66276.1 F420-dependent oxidoreductase [Mycoliciba
MDLAGVGVWTSQLRYGDQGQAAESAAELEELGFTALWIPDVSGGVLDSVEHLLKSTRQVVIATGILNLWMNDPADVAARFAALPEADRERTLLGIGVSHAPLIDSKEPGKYRRPLAATRAYLDAIDATPQPVPVANRVLAALGPKMLELAATRSRGAHPYLVTPDHTRFAREQLGTGPLLLPEQTVLLTTDRDEARGIGTDWLKSYLALPNYRNNLLRTGFSEDDVDSVSDRLFDAIIAWGDEDTVLRRVREHLDAGADHVCVQVLTADPREFPHEQWRRLADALTRRT